MSNLDEALKNIQASETKMLRAFALRVAAETHRLGDAAHVIAAAEKYEEYLQDAAAEKYGK